MTGLQRLSREAVLQLLDKLGRMLTAQIRAAAGNERKIDRLLRVKQRLIRVQARYVDFA